MQEVVDKKYKPALANCVETLDQYLTMVATLKGKVPPVTNLEELITLYVRRGWFETADPLVRSHPLATVGYRWSQFVQTSHLLQFTHWLATLPNSQVHPSVLDTILAQVIQEAVEASPFVAPVKKLLDGSPLNPILPKDRSISSTARREATSEYDLPSVLAALRVAQVAEVRPSEAWDLGGHQVALNMAREGKWDKAREIWGDRGDEIVVCVVEESCRTSGSVTRALLDRLLEISNLEVRAGCCLKVLQGKLSGTIDVEDEVIEEVARQAQLWDTTSKSSIIETERLRKITDIVVKYCGKEGENAYKTEFLK